MRYNKVNSRWPEGTNDGRDVIPTPQEAISGAKRLYRKALGKPFKGTFKITSGRRYTWIRSGVFFVNPNEKRWGHQNGGWHEIVHSISHIAALRLWGEKHGSRHASLEEDLIEYAVTHGFLDGKLRSKAKPAEVDKKVIKLDRIKARIATWQKKQQRAENALKKLERQRKYYERAA